MAKTVEDLFIYLKHIADLLILFLFLINFNRLKSEKGVWAIAIYCFVDLTISILETYFPLPTIILILLLAIYTSLEYLLFSYFIYLNLKKHRLKKVIPFASAAFIILLIVYYLTQEIRSIDSIAIAVETILIFIYAFFYFYEQMNDNQNLFIYNKYSFWIITGFLLYLSGSFFIYIFGNYIDRIILDQYWFLTNVFYILATFLYATGIIIFAKQKKRSKMKNHKISLSHLSF